jgi:hypothetical protein
MTLTQEQIQAEKDQFAQSFNSGVKLASAGLRLIDNKQPDLGRRLVKLGASMMDGYALSDVLSFSFAPQDLKLGAALCVEILEDEIAETID